MGGSLWLRPADSDGKMFLLLGDALSIRKIKNMEETEFESFFRVLSNYKL